MERVLVRLGARVAEEDATSRKRTERGQPIGEHLTEGVANGARVEEELLRLLGNRAHDARVAVAHRGDGVPAVSIEPAMAVAVDEPSPAAGDRSHGERVVDRQERATHAWRDERWRGRKCGRQRTRLYALPQH